MFILFHVLVSIVAIAAGLGTLVAFWRVAAAHESIARSLDKIAYRQPREE